MSFGDLPSMVTLPFFLGVNRSGSKTSSAANERSYNALEQLIGP